MKVETEPSDKKPCSIFEITVLTRFPGVVDDLLNTTYGSEDEIYQLLETRGYTLGDSTKVKPPKELIDILSGFSLRRQSIFDSKGRFVASMSVLEGDEDKLHQLNAIIEDWRNAQSGTKQET